MGGLDELMAFVDRSLDRLPVKAIPWIVATSLIIAGSMKLHGPADAGRAAKNLGLRLPMGDALLGRAIGLGEISIALASAAAVLIIPLAWLPLSFFAVLLGLVGLALVRGIDFTCSCFGTSARLSWLTLWRLIMFAALLIVYLATVDSRGGADTTVAVALGIGIPAVTWIVTVTRQAWLATRPLVYQTSEAR